VQILESPSKGQLAYCSRDFTFETLWARYIDIFVRLWRIVVQRYIVEPGVRRVVCAFELNNEPDYEWLPDELRIERAKDKNANPLLKYITELHYPQIPEKQVVAPLLKEQPGAASRLNAGPGAMILRLQTYLSSPLIGGKSLIGMFVVTLTSPNTRPMRSCRQRALRVSTIST
jgi:hypothetical protein